jgi:hypothetical protein
MSAESNSEINKNGAAAPSVKANSLHNVTPEALKAWREQFKPISPERLREMEEGLEKLGFKIERKTGFSITLLGNLSNDSTK